MSLTHFRRKFRRAIRPLLLGFAGIFFLSCFTFYGSNMFTRAQNQGGEYVAAKVNGEEIPRDLYERMAAMTVRQYEQMANMPGQPGGGRVSFEQQTQARGRAFESVVDSYLKAQAAEKEGIQVSGAEVRKAVDQQVKDQMGDKMEGATPEEIRQFEQQLRRIMPEDLTRKRLLIERLEKKLRERVKPTAQDVKANYNEAKIRHILIKTENGKPEEEARKKAEDVLAKVKAGGDFAKLAKQFSNDERSKAEGGDVGWVNGETQMVPEFKSAALVLKKGEVSPLVKTMFGYHILKADDARSKLPKDFNDPKKKEEYTAQVEEKLIKERMDNYFATLRVAAKIEPFDPFIAGYMAENEANGAASGGDMKTFETKIKEAAKHYETATQQNQVTMGPALWAKLAVMHNAAKQDDKAIQAVHKALEYSKSAELYVTLGEIYERKKQNAEAVKAYEQAMGLCYDQPWQYTNLQLKFKALKRDDLAKKAYGKWQEFVKRDDEQRRRQQALQQQQAQAATSKAK